MLKPNYPYNIYGVECAEGWKKLYEPLIEVCKQNNVEILQIKEKFGGLRFYVAGIPEDKTWIFNLIDTAEKVSFITCELCGLIDGQYPPYSEETKSSLAVTVKQWDSGYIVTRCNLCRLKR